MSFQSQTTTLQGQSEKRLASIARFGYSLICYLIGSASLVYFIGFVSGICPHINVNRADVSQPFVLALLGNIGLLLIFGLQHSVMARPQFKQWLSRFLDQSIERATYCLASALAIGIMCAGWIPMDGQVWQIQSETTANIVQLIGFSGWVILFIATFQLDHFELFGLRQTYSQLRGKPMPKVEFKTPGLYKVVRHPIQLGVLIGMWAVPTSTINHLVFAIGMTIYIFIGLYFEERDLIRQFGDRYRNYRQRVGKVIPFV